MRRDASGCSFSLLVPARPTPAVIFTDAIFIPRVTVGSTNEYSFYKRGGVATSLERFAGSSKRIDKLDKWSGQGQHLPLFLDMWTGASGPIACVRLKLLNGRCAISRRA